MNPDIRLSILMPVRNEARFVTQALNSIHPPSGIEIELIFVDDGSDDDSRAQAEAFAVSAPFHMKVISTSGVGKSAAFNLAYEACTGNHIILLAGDDILVSGALPARIDAVLGSGPKLAQCRYRTFSGDSPSDHLGTVYPRSRHHDHIAGGAASFNRDFAALYFPIPDVLVNEDTWLRAVRIAYQIPLSFVDQLGLHYRIHKGNSVGLFRSFSETDRNMKRRHHAFSLAIDSLKETAAEEGLARLIVLKEAEKLRADGRWLSLMLMARLPLNDRVTMIANSTPWLYFIKTIILPKLRTASIQFRRRI